MRRVFLLLIGLPIVAAVVVVLLAVAGVGAVQVDPANCRSGDVLAGVHDPRRIKVIERCMSVRGTVAVVQNNEEDGDWDIGLVPDPADLDLISRGNIERLGGLLVVEVIPMDQRSVNRPRIGSRVEVTGAYVIDQPNGWREIHPTWLIREMRPSPIPEGTGREVRTAVDDGKRLLLRLRAELRERWPF